MVKTNNKNQWTKRFRYFFGMKFNVHPIFTIGQLYRYICDWWTTIRKSESISFQTVLKWNVFACSERDRWHIFIRIWASKHAALHRSSNLADNGHSKIYAVCQRHLLIGINIKTSQILLLDSVKVVKKESILFISFTLPPLTEFIFCSFVSEYWIPNTDYSREIATERRIYSRNYGLISFKQWRIF